MRERHIARVLAPALLLCVAGGCDGDKVVPRANYNRGLRHLAVGELDKARDKVLSARDEAGADEALRFRSASALGHTLARQADAVEVAEPAQALELLRQSAAWFQDAARQRPKDDEPRKNLEKVLRRVQILADKLNEHGGLQAQLERIIADQRGLRDQVRLLLVRLDSDKVKDPVGFRSEFAATATQQRALMADVGTLIDSASDERDLIEQKGDEQRTDMDKVRAVQLQAATHYLERARAEQADTRRELRRLDAVESLSSAAGSLEALKRAREQLLDPIAVLKSIAVEQMELTAHTEALAHGREPQIGVAEDAVPQIPAWLTDKRLGERQAAIAERTAELGARLGAAQAPEGAELDAKQRRMLEAAVAAAPLVNTAEQKLRAAIEKLEARTPGKAAEHQHEATAALLEAAELFAEIRPLIELAYRGQKETVALLTPPEDDETSKLTTPERVSAASALISKTEARLRRLEALLSDELAIVDKQAAQAQGQAQPAQGQPGAEPDPAAAQRQRIEAAQQLRGLAAAALQRLSTALAGKDPEAAQQANEALQHIEALRRLYFTLVEHLKELRANQAETGDRTSDADSQSDEEKAALLGPLAERQNQHLAFGDELSKALAAQADAAAASGDEQAAAQAEKLGGAAEEVGKALLAMADAAGALTQAQKDATSMSVTLAGALEAQPTALEHLDEAIRILEPPQQDKDKQQQEQQQQQDQQQNQQQEPSEELSKQEALRRLEAIREREAERRRRQDKPASEAPVEKDW